MTYVHLIEDNFNGSPGRRVVRERWLHSERFALAVQVEMLVPPDADEEPCVGPAFVKFGREFHQRAAAGDLEWLRRHGRVYELVDSVA